MTRGRKYSCSARNFYQEKTKSLGEKYCIVNYNKYNMRRTLKNKGSVAVDGPHRLPPLPVRGYRRAASEAELAAPKRYLVVNGIVIRKRKGSQGTSLGAARRRRTLVLNDSGGPKDSPSRRKAWGGAGGGLAPSKGRAATQLPLAAALWHPPRWSVLRGELSSPTTRMWGEEFAKMGTNETQPRGPSR